MITLFVSYNCDILRKCITFKTCFPHLWSNSYVNDSSRINKLRDIQYIRLIFLRLELWKISGCFRFGILFLVFKCMKPNIFSSSNHEMFLVGSNSSFNFSVGTFVFKTKLCIESRLMGGGWKIINGNPIPCLCLQIRQSSI